MNHTPLTHAIAAFLLLVPLAFAAAETSQVVADADALHDQGSYPEAVKLLLGAATGSSGAQQAELYWRAARETMEIGDLAEKAGKPQDALLAVYVEGEGYADKAIAADPKNDLGYYWKSANIGRWGQVKGVLNALMKAQPMKDLLVRELSLNPDRTDPYYVLGELYRELPGWPVSFGNVDAAVSFGRRAVDARQGQVQGGVERELVYNFYTELAKTLYKRNWSAATRISEQKNKAAKLASAATTLDKASLYEATVTLKDMSDRDEARALVQSVITDLGKAPSTTAAERKDLQKAKDVLKGW
jgi:tetratricopeptide (TPR) repeat protein